MNYRTAAKRASNKIRMSRALSDIRCSLETLGIPLPKLSDEELLKRLNAVFLPLSKSGITMEEAARRFNLLVKAKP